MTKAKILVLEDGETTINLLRNILPTRLFCLTFVKTQKELLDKLKKIKKDVDLVITDLKTPRFPEGVPELVSIDYFQQIHRIAPNLDIIIFTGSSYENYDKIKDFWKNGLYFHLNKENSPAELILLVIDFCLKTNNTNNYPATSYKKGKALEDLMVWIFNSIKGFSINRNIRTKKGEVDIIIINGIWGSSFWLRKGDNIPVECKNRKKDQKEGIRSNNIFQKKMEKIQYCTLGFFVSTQGFSPDFLNELTFGKKCIIPIDDYKIKELVQSNERITLLADYIIPISQNRK